MFLFSVVNVNLEEPQICDGALYEGTFVEVCTLEAV